MFEGILRSVLLDNIVEVKCYLSFPIKIIEEIKTTVLNKMIEKINTYIINKQAENIVGFNWEKCLIPKDFLLYFDSISNRELYLGQITSLFVLFTSAKQCVEIDVNAKTSFDFVINLFFYITHFILQN